MLAKFPGRCSSCADPIKVGESILAVGAKGPWVHEACHAAAGELLLDGVLPKPAKAPAGASAGRTTRPRSAAMTEPEGAVVVFTDGACRGNPGPGGWAWAEDEQVW